MIEISKRLGWKVFPEGGTITWDGNIIEFPPNIQGVDYDSNGIPTQAMQDAWKAEYDQHVANIDYIKKSKAGYMPDKEQFDMEYWDRANKAIKWFNDAQNKD